MSSSASTMEFWGAEVKSGQALKVENGSDQILHLSNVTIGEPNSGNEKVSIFLKINDNKFVLGWLSSEIPQLSFDLVFEKDFELSHSSKDRSVHFFGYKHIEDATQDESGSESESDDDIPLHLENGKSELKAEPVKPSTTKASAKSVSVEKAKVKAETASKNEKSKEEAIETDSDDEDDDFKSSDDNDDDDMKLVDGEDDISDEDGDEISSDAEEDTLKKSEGGKPKLMAEASKRTGPGAKSPVPAKKAKFTSTPQKTDGKKAITNPHTATPYPAKQPAKPTSGASMPGGAQKSAQTPKSGTPKFVCTTCSKTLNSEKGLEAHTKAKHGGT